MPVKIEAVNKLEISTQRPENTKYYKLIALC